MRLRRWLWICSTGTTAAQIMYVTGDAVAGLQDLLNQIEAQNQAKNTVRVSRIPTDLYQPSTSLRQSSTSTQVEQVKAIYTAVVGTDGVLNIPDLTLDVPALASTSSPVAIATQSKTTVLPVTSSKAPASAHVAQLTSMSTSVEHTTSTSTATSRTMAVHIPENISSAAIVVAAAVTERIVPAGTTTSTSTMTSFATIFVTIKPSQDSSMAQRATSESTIFMTTTMTIVVQPPTGSIETLSAILTYDLNASPTTVAFVHSSAYDAASSGQYSRAISSLSLSVKPTATYVGLATPSLSGSNSTAESQVAANNERSTAVTTVATIGGVLGAGLISGMVILGLLVRRSRRKISPIDDVYGGRRAYNDDRKGGRGFLSLFAQRHFKPERSVSPSGYSISHPRSITKQSFDLTRMQDRFERQEARLTRQKRDTVRRSRPASLTSSRSSVYTTDQKIPLKLGSPVRMMHQSKRPESDELSYRIPSWRYKDDKTTQPLSIAKKKSASGLMASHFSLASDYSEFGPYMSRIIPKSSAPKTSNEPLPMPGHVPARNFSRPNSSSTVATSVSQGQDTASENAALSKRYDRQKILPAKIWTVEDVNEIGPQDGRKTQVYKLLKRALGR